MKLASLKGGRDGRLVVVSRDLSRYADASDIAPTLQAALDDWEANGHQLEELARKIEDGSVPTHPFDESECHSPLPRAYQAPPRKPGLLARLTTWLRGRPPQARCINPQKI